MPKAQELTLEQKAQAQIDAENKARLEATMRKIAADEAAEVARIEQEKREEEQRKAQAERAKIIKAHQQANNALTQTITQLQKPELANTPHGIAFIKARDKFLKEMIKAGVSNPALNLLK